jgi:hypothetical protein
VLKANEFPKTGAISAFRMESFDILSQVVSKKKTLKKVLSGKRFKEECDFVRALEGKIDYPVRN